MSNIDLLETVLARDGRYCVTGLKSGRVNQTFHDTLDEVYGKAAELMTSRYDVYFALATFNGANERTKENVKLLQSFWLDIDCGEKKAEVDPKTGKPDGYIDQAAAIAALHSFCELVGLPTPIIVNSGRGIHAYWPLTEAITRTEWEPVGKRLAQLCETHEFFVDPNVFEVARILRIPGTLNYKDDPPALVEMVSEDAPTVLSVDDFRSILGVVESEVETITYERKELTDLGKMLQENITSSFSKIMRRGAEGKGCNQLVSCYQDRATLAEPRWFNALSVAKFCKDAGKVIHRLSEGYPDYDPAVTEAKIHHIKGPHTCEQFERNNPGGCDGCPFQGKIGSPITLGRELAVGEAEGEVEDEVEDEGAEPEDALSSPIPPYPAPFARGKNGGIYFVPKDEEAEPILVYEHDIYVVKRMEDPSEGEVFVLCRHLPRDGVKQFVVPAVQMVDKKELQKIVSSNGVLCHGKPLEYLLWMLIAMAKDMQIKQRAVLMRTQFGWADNDSKFIIGDREITKDGIFHSPPSAITSNIAQYMNKAGTLDKWKEVFALYGRPGLEPNAYAALTAFGAPLLKFTGQKGSIINVIHPSSGTGKTTTLHMCNSVYGAPDRLYAVKEDTLNAKIMRLGIMNTLPFTCDEITNATAEEFSTLAYSMSQGRGKDRVMSQSNQMRLNLTSWQTISLCSSNASFYERMSAAKSRADGEMMRLLEYKIDYSNAIDTGVAKEMFDHQLMENYGHAGEIYATWLVNNMEEAVKAVHSIQAKLDGELRLTQRERCWSANVAANITGGKIAKRLGLIDWDMGAIYMWVAKVLNEMRNQVVAPVTDSMAVIGQFINSHMQNILVVNDEVDLRTKMSALPVMEPKGRLIIRYEPDTKHMYICASEFKAECNRIQNNYSEVVRDLRSRGILIDVKNKRMAKGMPVNVPGVTALMLNAGHADFISIDPILPPQELSNGSGESHI
jgi:hypothetical protein